MYMYQITCGAGVLIEKKPIATKRKISLLGFQAVDLMSQGQIAAIGEELQYFWQILISRHGCPNLGPFSHALTRSL